MADYKYRGYFTVRDNGVDVKAKVEIFTGTGNISESSVVEVPLSSDPVSITWDTARITDCLHPSQMRVSMIAESDGAFRFFKNLDTTVRAVLYIQTNSGWSAWWRGALGSLTWDEPFSRANNNTVSLTFSDFGYLERIQYDGRDTAESIRVGDLLKEQLGRIYGDNRNAIVEYKSVGMQLGNVDLDELRVLAKAFFGTDGSPFSVRDIVENVLSPVGAHIMQYNGKFVVFGLNSDTYDTCDDTMSTLRAAGTDARLSMAESYKSIKLTYDQEPSDTLFNLGLKTEDAGASGPWQYPSLGEGYLVCGPEKYSDGNSSFPGYRANLIKGSNITPCVWLVNGYDPQFEAPAGVSKPTDMNTSLPSLFTSIEFRFPVTGINNSRHETGYPDDDTEIELTIPILLVFKYSGGVVRDVSMDSMIIFHPTNPDEPEQHYYDGAWGPASRYNTIRYSGEYPGHYTGNVDFQDFKVTLPPPQGRGVVSVYLYFNSLYYTAEGASGDPKILNLAVGNISASMTKGSISSTIELINTITESVDTDADDFSKTFAMGVPEKLQLGTYTHYTAYQKDQLNDEYYIEHTIRSNTFLKLYADYLKAQVLGVRRWKVKGTYMYTHLFADIPFFSAEQSQPLVSLADGVSRKLFFVRSEEWRLRSGFSTLELEEVQI